MEENNTTSGAASQDVSTPAATPTTAPAGGGSVGKGKILIVEDDKFLREMLVKKLFEAGFDIQPAIDSPSAFESLSTRKPDVILLDLMLPGEDGFSILGKLRAAEETKETPVIILSNLGQQDDVKKALDLGATDFMVKANFTIDEIAKKLNELIGK